MVVAIRDRVRTMIAKGMTLDAVMVAGYDGRPTTRAGVRKRRGPLTISPDCAGDELGGSALRKP